LRENHTLKRALTDPRLFSGIGNTYSDEILHRAGLSPIAQTHKLDSGEVLRLYASARSVLAEWTLRLREEAGSGFPAKVTAFRPQMAVHGRFGQPCPDCGAPVQRIVYAENETNYCARCDRRHHSPTAHCPSNRAGALDRRVGLSRTPRLLGAVKCAIAKGGCRRYFCRSDNAGESSTGIVRDRWYPPGDRRSSSHRRKLVAGKPTDVLALLTDSGHLRPLGREGRGAPPWARPAPTAARRDRNWWRVLGDTGNLTSVVSEGRTINRQR
jgi:hypothetical protein